MSQDPLVGRNLIFGVLRNGQGKCLELFGSGTAHVCVYTQVGTGGSALIEAHAKNGPNPINMDLDAPEGNLFLR